MSILEAVILAIVEGLTEFLPISSTGHMIIAQGIMGMESTLFLRAFTVMIQFGAILSVVALYFKRFFIPNRNSLGGRDWKQLGAFYLKLIVGVLPAVVLGILFESQIDALLSNVWVVAAMLVVGGVFMLFLDQLFYKTEGKQISYKNALVVGLFQCIAMIPGVSRSMATIVGGLQQGLNRKTAAEFSFFLAVPTMLGATLKKGYELYAQEGITVFRDNVDTLLIGNAVAFIVAMLAIKFFIGFVTKHGFRLFGYYRIVVGCLVIILLLCGMHLTVA